MNGSEVSASCLPMEGRTMGCRRYLLCGLLAGIVVASFQARAGNLSMKAHMEIESQIQSDADLKGFPSIQIDTIQATAALNDRMNADDAFDRPFTDSLADGMTWYLKQRGVQIL